MEGISLYIHIPFCVKKCLYCDFPSLSGMEKYMIPYAESLAYEIENVAKDKEVKTIFIGGGTPTYLSFEAWKIIGRAIKTIHMQSNVEFTVEANPNTVDDAKLELLKEIGVNRLSIGLQAWQNSILNSIGRIHSKEDFIEAYNMARHHGFDNINVDIMLALPNQDIIQLDETLKNVIKLNPEHISCYSLIIEEKTPFYKLYKENKLQLPDEDEEREMYWEAVNILKQNDYIQYEISNFAKSGYECKHNLVYWNADEYIGCGAAAHSFFNNTRYKNISNIPEYIDRINNNIDIKEEIHKNSQKDNMEEFMFMGLRKNEGISITKFRQKFSKDIYSVYGETINKYVKMGLLLYKNHRLFLSSRGMDVCNTVMADFILE